jgi:hypothetical protein
MQFQVVEGRVAVTDGENSFDAVAQTAAQENCEDESFRGDLKDAFRENKWLERERWRQNRGNEGAEEAVVIHPRFYFLRFAAGMLVKKGLAGFFRDEIEDQAAGERAERGHRGVVGHERGFGDAEFDEDRVREKWEGKHGRIEESDDEKAASAEGHDQTLQPQKYFPAAHVGKMLLEIRTIVAEFARTSGSRAISVARRKLLYLVRSVRICA